MANKSFDFYVRYVDPDEASINTPSQRRERIAGPYTGTGVKYALSKFFKEVADKPGAQQDPTHEKPWLKKDILVLDVMRGKGQAGPQMADSDDEEG